MNAGYLRCGHCRGFYELALSHCRYCGKAVPLRDAEGKAKVFADRQTCRAIQIAEFEQLPKEAHDDPMQPDPELLDKLCYCLHCGPEGQPFEAVEMRWMANEGMWACPCTTCGGRGFAFDIHLTERLWQCAECSHWYTPANGDARASNAKCPKCGSTMANGWFDDEVEDGAEGEDAELLEKDWEGFDETRGSQKFQPQAMDERDAATWKPGMEAPYMEKLRDDIDFPHDRPKGHEEGVIGNDDIPW